MMSVMSRVPRQLLLCSNFRQTSLMASMTKAFSTTGQVCSENKDDQQTKESSDESQSANDKKRSQQLMKAACVVGGGALLFGAAPYVLSAAGFTAVGIKTGTLAASMQGTQIVGTYVVPTLQSLGAGGLGVGGTVASFGTGGYLGAKTHNTYHFIKKKLGKSTGGGDNDGGSGSPTNKTKSKL